jgi:hypothetical protein
MIEYIPRQEFNAVASLHFLGSGHYLFRFLEDGREASKFVTAVDVAAAFSMKELDTGWLPAGVVRCGQNAAGPWFVYSTPPQKVKLSLEKAAINGGDLPLTIPVPRLALIGSGGSYWLAAMRGKHFEYKAMAYHAPFPNVHPSGKICWGGNTPPEAKPENARRAWELFFESPFNADLAGGKSQRHSKDVRELLKTLDHNHRLYPISDLISMNIPIERLVEKVIGGNA